MNTNLSNLNSVTVHVTLSDKIINPVNLILTQIYGDHHHFEITLDYDAHGDDFMSNPVKQIELIGKLAVMRFSHKGQENDYYLFTGVITDVRQTGHEGKKGYLIVSGASPTIMLEKGKRIDVYSNKTLRGVFELLVEGVHYNYIKYVNNPVYTNRVDFLMQYNENDWEFLKRIAFLYKENLFYSGSEILFGKYKEWDPVQLTYDKEITDLEFCSQMIPNNLEYFQYVASRDTIIERKSPEKIDNSNDYINAAENRSTVLTNKKTAKSFLDTPSYDSSEITELLKREKSRNAAQTIKIKGRSKTYKSTIGRLIDVVMPPQLTSTSNIGTYRVIKSIHRIDEKLRYSNEFEAVPASLDTMPVKEPKMPQADSVIGKIRSNEDPLNQGRVQVDFDFARNYNFSWLRVLTPNAGSSDTVSQNRGMVFVPEKGDQVMIGFEYGDPNRPYVMGSLFHGKNGKGGESNNHIKTIITRQGHTIELDDAEESLGITFKDKNGNIIHLDTKGKNIEITAPETIMMKAKNIQMKAEENINIAADKNIIVEAVNNYLSNIKNDLVQIVGRNFSVEANSTIDIFGKDQIIGYSNKIDMGAINNMRIHGSTTELTAEQEVRYKAPTMNMLPQKDPFVFDRNPQILDLNWTDESREKKLSIVDSGDNVSLFARTRNTKEGDIIKMTIKEILSDGTEQDVVVEGTVDADNYVFLKNLKTVK